MENLLRERTVVIFGPVKTTLQNLVMGLTQLGADVAMIDPDADKLQKFAQNITDQREANSKFGRATAIAVDWKKSDSVKDAFGKAAQTFGSIDIFIDALATAKPTPLQIGQDDASLPEIVHENLTVSLQATQTAAHFLKSRKKGRIIYLLQSSMNKANFQDSVATAARTGLLAFSQCLSKELLEHNVTVNCVSLGLTEEYLLGHFPEATSLKDAQEKMRATDAKIKITEPDKITQVITFLCGPSGIAVTGQHLTIS